MQIGLGQPQTVPWPCCFLIIIIMIRNSYSHGTTMLAFIVAVCCAFRAHSLRVVVLDQDGYTGRATAIASALNTTSTTTSITVLNASDALGNGLLTPTAYDWVVVPSSPALTGIYTSFPGKAVSTLLSFAAGGGNVAFLGGK